MEISKMSKPQLLNFIRTVLMKTDATEIGDHYRFEMSGYESKTGATTLHNQFVLNKFSELGLYDYTSYLFLDFYKGSPILYFQYFHDDEPQRLEYNGYGTTEIIYEILKLTVLSGKGTRRRI